VGIGLSFAFLIGLHPGLFIGAQALALLSAVYVPLLEQPERSEEIDCAMRMVARS
jgi:hypothetical protein